MSWEAATGNCGSATEPSIINLTRVGADVSTTLQGAALKGTLYESWDFLLRGGFDRRLTMRGRFTSAGSGSGDAGTVQLAGTLTTEQSADGGVCSSTEKFTGSRL